MDIRYCRPGTLPVEQTCPGRVPEPTLTTPVLEGLKRGLAEGDVSHVFGAAVKVTRGTT